MTVPIPLTKSLHPLVDYPELADASQWLRLDPDIDVLRGQHPHREWEYAMAVTAIWRWGQESGRPPDKILDVGGAGSDFGRRLEQVYEVVIVDPGAQGPGHLPIRLEDREGPKVDVILAISVLEHVPNDLAFLKACARQLARGGLLFLTADIANGGVGMSDTRHFHWMRERIYTMERLVAVGLVALRDTGVEIWGGMDLDYHGDHVYDYSFGSLCLRKHA